MVNVRYTPSILGSQSGSCSHSIAAMGSNHFLVSFQSAVFVLVVKGKVRRGKTDAPPELSEPAIISIRLLSMFHRIGFIAFFSLQIRCDLNIEYSHTRRVRCCREKARKTNENVLSTSLAEPSFGRSIPQSRCHHFWHS